ncbi:hypothetical protein GJ744_000446 [Endocarpon pusillum]|uniref:Uncharacterized protein n=1 Tax=Endocarpon pusillum TaxID=364733 RepID=A0A8H7AII5_9EURO|nr:hypothetical protein GJ744_000446 [Endocarpon pusillum]
MHMENFEQVFGFLIVQSLLKPAATNNPHEHLRKITSPIGPGNAKAGLHRGCPNWIDPVANELIPYLAASGADKQQHQFTYISRLELLSTAPFPLFSLLQASMDIARTTHSVLTNSSSKDGLASSSRPQQRRIAPLTHRIRKTQIGYTTASSNR